MTEDQAFDALQAYLTKVNAEAIILNPSYVALAEINRSHQSAPRPSGPYALITLIGGQDNNEAEFFCYADITVGTGDDAEERVVENAVRSYEFKFRIDIYAARPSDYAKLFDRALRSGRASVEMPGFQVRRIDPLTEGPQLVEQQWEGRANFSVELVALHSEPLLIDVIDKGSIQITGKGGVDIDVSVPFERT